METQVRTIEGRSTTRYGLNIWNNNSGKMNIKSRKHGSKLDFQNKTKTLK